jgi:hypothetical protein
MAVADELLISPIQKKMLAVLSDRQRHSPEELHACLSDEMTPIRNISPHLAYLRRALRPLGQDIISQRLSGKTYYLLIEGLGASYPPSST